MFLELDLATILFEIANFLVLAFLLYRFLFRPFMARVEERAEEKRRLMREAEQDRETAARMHAEAERRLDTLDERLSEMLQDAREEIETERREVMDSIRHEAEQMLKRARDEAQETQRQQLGQYEEELIDSIVNVARNLIAKSAPQDMHEKLVRELTAEVWEMGSEQMERVEAVRRSLGDRDLTAQVTTARPLSPELQRELVQTFSAVADHTVSFDIQVDPELGAGARVRMGDMVVEHSVARQLDRLRDEVASKLRELAGD